MLYSSPSRDQKYHCTNLGSHGSAVGHVGDLLRISPRAFPHLGRIQHRQRRGALAALQLVGGGIHDHRVVPHNALE